MKLRIGIPLIGSAVWHGGITYIEAILRAFRALPHDEQPDIWLLVGVAQEGSFSLYEYLLPLVNGIIGCGIDAKQFIAPGAVRVSIEDFQEVEKYVDFIFPVNSDCLPGFAYASWIPDLQHKHLPQFFTAADIVARDSAMDFIAETAETIVFSSRSAKDGFEKIYPDFGGRADVIPFYSRFDNDVFSVDPIEIVKKYGLPDRYMICCNQFWQHKNHDGLFRGLAQTDRPIHMVLTGGQADYRNENWFPYLKKLITELDIESRVTLLGFIPRSDQIQLMRHAVGIVQPSFYEGWSTVLEDARGLGKHVLASDIAVHQEQAIFNTTYFDPQSPGEIASLMDVLDASQSAGTDLEVERTAQNAVSDFQIAAARLLLRLASDSIAALAAGRRSGQAKTLNSLRYQTARVMFSHADLYKKQQIIDALLLDQANNESHIALQKNLIAIAEKEALIINQHNQIKELHQILGLLRLLLPILRRVNRFFNIFRPRLGNLNQYRPRALTSLGAYRRKSSEQPLLSIVTPSFGQAKFIERTLCSVLNQQYPRLEYFVQDGGSNDGTKAILALYEDQLTGWESKPDGGQAEAINIGFSKTSGEIMAWLNSDDLLLPGALAFVVDYFNAHPDVDVVYGDRLLIDEKDMEIGRWLMPGHSSDILSWVDYVPQETMFWRRRIWDKTGGRIDESFKFALDWDLLVRFRDAGAKFAHVTRFLGAFRIHEHQKTSAAINEIGYREMERIRERLLGRIPVHKEIRKAVLPYLMKHAAIDMAYRIKTRIHNKS